MNITYYRYSLSQTVVLQSKSTAVAVHFTPLKQDQASLLNTTPPQPLIVFRGWHKVLPCSLLSRRSPANHDEARRTGRHAWQCPGTIHRRCVSCSSAACCLDAAMSGWGGVATSRQSAI